MKMIDILLIVYVGMILSSTWSITGRLDTIIKLLKENKGEVKRKD